MFSDFCNEKEENCFNTQGYEDCYYAPETEEELKKYYKSFPILNFNFGGMDYRWLPRDYLVDELGY